MIAHVRSCVIAALAVCGCGGSGQTGDAGADVAIPDARACDPDASTFVLADAQSYPYGIALSGVTAFWTTENAIMSAAPCTTPAVVANESGVAIAADDANIYWTSRIDSLHVALRTAPRDGGAPKTLAADPMPDALSNVVLDDTYAYYGCSGGVVRVPKTGASAPTFVETDFPVQWALAVDATNVYFGGGAGGLMSVPKSGGTPTNVGPAGPAIGAIVLDATNVYWASAVPQNPPVANDWVISSVPKAGGQVTILASSEVAVSGSGAFGVDQSFVYWSNDDKELRYAGFVGGQSAVLRSSGLGGGLAVGDHTIVWTGYYDGIVAGMHH